MKEQFAKIIDNIANLIKVKTVVTFVVIAVFAILALKGVIQSEYVKDIVLMVVAFYFGTQTRDEK